MSAAQEQNKAKHNGAMAHVCGMELWKEVWFPMMDAVARGELTKDFAVKQWNEVLNRNFAKPQQRLTNGN